MSRQHGRRTAPRRLPKRPKAGKDPKKERRVRTRRPRPDRPEVPYDRDRFWKATFAGTAAAVITSWLFIVTFLVTPEDSDQASVFSFIALILMPLTFLVAAKVSRRPDATLATAKAAVFGLGVGILVTYAAQETVSGMVAMFGTGGAFVLPRPPQAPWTHRGIAIVSLVLLIGTVVRLVPVVALAMGPLMAMPVLGIADRYAVRQAQD